MLFLDYKFAVGLAAVTVMLALQALPASGNAKGNPIVGSLGTSGNFSSKGFPNCMGEYLKRKISDSVASCLAKLDSAERADPASLARVLTTARVYLHYWKYPKARKIIQDAREHHSNSARYLHFSARLALSEYENMGKTNRFADFSRDLAAALELAPWDLDILATRAYGLFKAARIEDSLWTYGVVLGVDPDHIYSLMKRAQLHRDQGHSDSAIKDLNRAVSAAPDNLLVRSTRLSVYKQLGQHKNAIADADYLLGKNPNDAMLLQERASALYFSGQKLKAIKDLNNLLEDFHGSPRYILRGEQKSALLRLRATIFRELGRGEEAAGDILKALAMGGRQGILRTQVYLRRMGFSHISITGEASAQLRDAIKDCYANAKCSAGLIRKA